MKFVSTFLLTEAVEKFTLIPPCEGYFEDMSLQAYLPGIEEGEKFWFMMGKRLNDAVTALVPSDKY